MSDPWTGYKLHAGIDAAMARGFIFDGIIGFLFFVSWEFKIENQVKKMSSNTKSCTGLAHVS